MDTHDRIDLTGPWAGFGFQGNHMFTPEGYSLENVVHMSRGPRRPKRG